MQTSQIDFKQQQNVLKTYQKNVSNIYKERKRILQNISEKLKQKKFLTPSQDKTQPKQRKSQTEIQDNPRKLIKLQSQTAGIKSNEDGTGNKDVIKFEQKPQIKAQQKSSPVPQAIADRNRRIFGGLTSYLKKAGQHLQSKQEKQKSQNAKQILNKFISKEKQQREEIQKKQKQQLQSQLNNLQQQKRVNEEKLNKAQNQMLGFIVKSHYNAIGKYFMTKTEPRIFWMPKKEIEDLQKLQKIKQIGQKYLKKQQEDCLEQIGSYNEVFDHGKYMTQNQRQFYQSYIKRMFLDHKNFISTKSEPSIFWRAKKPFPGMEKVIEETSLSLDEKRDMLINHNSEYYRSRQTNIMEEHNKEFSDEQNQEEEKLE